MSVCCECCVLSGIGLCDALITRPEESYRLWCVVVCDLETSWMRGHGPRWASAPQGGGITVTAMCCASSWLGGGGGDNELMRGLVEVHLSTSSLRSNHAKGYDVSCRYQTRLYRCRRILSVHECDIIALCCLHWKMSYTNLDWYRPFL